VPAPTPRARRTVAALVLAAALGLPSTAASAAPTDTVTFADPVFRTCVAAALGMRPSHPITPAQAASVTDLDCGELSPTSLGGAQALTNLTTLSVSYGSTVSDLTPLAGLSRLRELTLPFSRITDLAPLRGLTGLERVDVYGNPVSGLAPLSALTRLTYLDITGSSWTTLEPLRRLTQLRRLSADQEGQVDIAAVGALTGLQRLDLVVPDVRDLAPLRTLTGLTQLNVQAAATDVSALTPMSRLRVLSLNVAAGDGRALVGKPDLTELSVYGVRLPSLGVLSSSTRLSYLVAVAPSITDVAALQGLPELSELILSGVDRADFSPLRRLPQLSYVSVSDSRVGPVRQFNGFDALSSLQLNNDQITSVDGFDPPANLSSLDVSGNHLADISALGCGLLVNALAQTVDVGRAPVGSPTRLPLVPVEGQTVQLGRSTDWTSTGPTLTYARAGTYRVPFVAVGPPDCDQVQFAGVVTQTASAGRPMRPPRDR
jgi:internalin A